MQWTGRCPVASGLWPEPRAQSPEPSCLCPHLRGRHIRGSTEGNRPGSYPQVTRPATNRPVATHVGHGASTPRLASQFPCGPVCATARPSRSRENFSPRVSRVASVHSAVHCALSPLCAVSQSVLFTALSQPGLAWRSRKIRGCRWTR